MKFITETRRKIHELLHKDASPHSIALGLSIGIFWGLTPLFGIKTILGIVSAWLFRADKMAAVLAVSLHEAAVPIMPILFHFEHKIGNIFIKLPEGHFNSISANVHQGFIPHFQVIFTTGLPMLVGGLILGACIAVPAYFVFLIALKRLDKRTNNAV